MVAFCETGKVVKKKIWYDCVHMVIVLGRKMRYLLTLTSSQVLKVRTAVLASMIAAIIVQLIAEVAYVPGMIIGGFERQVRQSFNLLLGKFSAIL